MTLLKIKLQEYRTLRPLIIHNAVTQEFLNSLADRSFEQFKKAKVSNSEGKKNTFSMVRRCWTDSVTDNEVVNKTVSSIFAKYKDIETNGNIGSNLTLYREQDAGNYGLHQDVYYSQDDVRKLSMSILITDDFTGGELFIMGDQIDLQKGDAVIFPSFLPHLVTPVKTGSRLALVSWMYGPQWK